MKKSYKRSTHYELIVYVFIIISINLYLKLCFGSTKIDFTLGNIMSGWVSSVDWLRCNFLYSFLKMLWILSIQSFNFQEPLCHVQIHGSLFAALQNYLIVIMDPISFQFVFETTQRFEMSTFGPKLCQVYLVAGVIFICAHFSSLQETLAWNVQKLDNVTIVNNLS